MNVKNKFQEKHNKKREKNEDFQIGENKLIFFRNKIVRKN